MELGRGAVVEHRSTRTGRWLRERRIRLVLAVALAEGLLIVVDVVPWGLALLVAAAVVIGYLALRDRLGSDAVRQVGWIAAASQAIVAIVPVLLAVATLLALIVLAVIGIVALLVLLGDRR